VLKAWIVAAGELLAAACLVCTGMAIMFKVTASSAAPTPHYKWPMAMALVLLVFWSAALLAAVLVCFLSFFAPAGAVCCYKAMLRCSGQPTCKQNIPRFVVRTSDDD
jgi:hypothetical protein